MSRNALTQECTAPTMPDRLLIALGGNAFVTPDEPLTMAGQFQFAGRLAEQLAPLLASERQIVITHGNGPQVGHMLIRVEEALGKAYAVPLEVCVAESEGELGYVLEQSLHNMLRERGIERPIAGVLTQVVVNHHDPAFNNPSKPIGPFYDAAQADRLKEEGFDVREDAGRGYRRVVPSPRPVRIVESDVIAALLELGVIVIAAGGGGIPVVEEVGRLVGVEAVIDKDLSSAVLAEALSVNLLLILTGVPCAYRWFGTDRQEPIVRAAPDEAESMLDEGHFAAGSMRPKIEAAIQFARTAGRKSIICDPPSALEAIKGRAGTTIGVT